MGFWVTCVQVDTAELRLCTLNSLGLQQLCLSAFPITFSGFIDVQITF
jgi:hypothetical protein